MSTPGDFADTYDIAARPETPLSSEDMAKANAAIERLWNEIRRERLAERGRS